MLTISASIFLIPGKTSGWSGFDTVNLAMASFMISVNSLPPYRSALYPTHTIDLHDTHIR